jgi:hypothetical protein
MAPLEVPTTQRVIGQHVHKSACRRVFHAAIYRENGAGFCITR